MSATRLLVVACCLMTTTALLRAGRGGEPVESRVPLTLLPMSIGEWQGRQSPAFEERVLANLGVDEYVNRVYIAPGGEALGLYLGYYRTQRHGDTIHSPLNCLPGAGWQPVDHRRLTLRVREARGGVRPIEINRYLVQKGLDRQLVLYWYQSHGRVIASEYWGKVYTVVDAIRLNRTEAALVRLVTPLSDNPGDDVRAEERTVEFIQRLFPLLERHLPL